jgi:hypothetical protein
MDRHGRDRWSTVGIGTAGEAKRGMVSSVEVRQAWRGTEAYGGDRYGRRGGAWPSGAGLGKAGAERHGLYGYGAVKLGRQGWAGRCEFR